MKNKKPIHTKDSFQCNEKQMSCRACDFDFGFLGWKEIIGSIFGMKVYCKKCNRLFDPGF